MDKKIATVFGLFMGLYLDILTSKFVGLSCIMYALIGFICGYLDKSFSKESKITIILIVAGSTFFYELTTYIYMAIYNNLDWQVVEFLKILIIEVLFNGLLTIILYPMIKSIGNITERIFKNKNINMNYIFNR